MAITLDTIDGLLHSISIIDAGGDELAIAADGSIAITDNGSSLTVDAVQLDIDDLDHATDSVAIGDGTDFLAIAADGSIAVTDNGSSLTVDAVQLDIDDLDHANDSVKIGDGTDFLEINADGSINVQTFTGGFASWKTTAASIDTTVGGTELVATPLSGRLSILIQNLGSNDVYLKDATGVTVANGLKLAKGSSFEALLDDGADVWAIASSGTADIRTTEYAA
jgi:hypothetical protein